MQASIAAPGETGPNLQARLGARARAAALIPIVMDLPGLAGAARALTADPRIEQQEIDGVPVTVTRPAGKGPFPAWVFVTGAHPLRRREPVVQRLAEGLARSATAFLAQGVVRLLTSARFARDKDACDVRTRRR